MNRTSLAAISEEDIRAYRDDGVVCLRGLFDADWVDRLRTAADRAMAAPGPRSKEHTKAGGEGRFHVSLFLWRTDPDFRAFVFESPAAEIAARLTGADTVRFFYDQLFVKEPGTREVTHWHHDLPFWPMRGEDIPSIWLALTAARRESSVPEYIAGSHRWGKFYRADTPDSNPALADDALEPCPDFDRERDNADYRFLSWDLEPGDVLVHHPLTVHGAGGNQTADLRRMGLSTRWFGADARWDPRPATMRIEGDVASQAGEAPRGEAFPEVWPRQVG